MASLIWTEPALQDLDAIADYIALDKPRAARDLVQRVFQHVEQLTTQPESGSVPRELKRSRYRQIIRPPGSGEPPCRIFYRYDGKRVYILYVMRGEMRFRKSQLVRRKSRGREV
jgi:toxin ParE1/3/4